MLDLLRIAVDPNKVSKGAWVKWEEGGEFLIARFNNRAAENERAQLNLEMLDMLGEGKEISEEMEQEYRNRNADILARLILLDWKGVGAAGEEIPYSVENATEILSDERYMDLMEFILRASLTRENYMASNEEEVVDSVKNS